MQGMGEHEIKTYGPALASVLQPRIMPLGPGVPDMNMRPKLAELTVERAFEGRDVVDELMAQAVLSGVWLYHDFLDESHTISQSIDTPTGSFWHGIMHRREPDYSNAKYWFRRTGHHDVFEPLAEAAAGLTAETTETRLVHLSTEPAWDPFDFVDLVQTATEEGGEVEQACVEIQNREWWLLFDYCWRAAVGARGTGVEG